MPVPVLVPLWELRPSHSLGPSSHLQMGPAALSGKARQPIVLAHLGMVSSRVLGHSTLLLHQKAEPPAFFSECRLVAVRHVVLQLALLIADGIDVLEAGDRGDRSVSRRQILLGFRQHIQSCMQAALGIPAQLPRILSCGGPR